MTSTTSAYSQRHRTYQSDGRYSDPSLDPRRFYDDIEAVQEAYNNICTAFVRSLDPQDYARDQMTNKMAGKLTDMSARVLEEYTCQDARKDLDNIEFAHDFLSSLKVTRGLMRTRLEDSALALYDFCKVEQLRAYDLRGLVTMLDDASNGWRTYGDLCQERGYAMDVRSANKVDLAGVVHALAGEILQKLDEPVTPDDSSDGGEPIYGEDGEPPSDLDDD